MGVPPYPPKPLGIFQDDPPTLHQPAGYIHPRGLAHWKPQCDRLNLTSPIVNSLRAPPDRAPLYPYSALILSLIHISEPTRLLSISYAVFCLKKKKPSKIKNLNQSSITKNK
eukprot:TRINITY_DN36177_c0_g1_i1.p1 TRINITY_DN36177_c0_g1~~TRINITY_DN36177_c0_g1_i1.p1  ORF type:complete len:112 (-),score=1.47 TRINITY_DN36177_c0_g1_i1:42-377(-)